MAKLNFSADFDQIIREDLKKHNISSSHLKDDALWYTWLNYYLRKIPAQPRKVYISRELIIQSSYADIVSQFQHLLENGSDITPFLSVQSRDPQFRDSLIYDWSIHHFHTGVQNSANKKATRTKELIFMRITNDSAYVINIYDHTKFADPELIRIIHRNWPETISDFKIEGQPSIPLKDSDYKLLRKNSITTFVDMKDGTGYMPLGLGFMGDGSSSNIRFSINDIKRYLFNCETYVSSIVENSDKLNSHIPYLFHFAIKMTNAYAIDVLNQIYIPLGKHSISYLDTFTSEMTKWIGFLIK